MKTPLSSLTTFTVKVNGKAISDTTQIKSFEVTFATNRISSACIEILDGDASKSDFEVSSSDTFVPGNEISIDAGYDSNNKEVFKGIIISQNISINPGEGSMLEILCRDEAIKTTIGRKSSTFSQKKDSEIINSILGSYSKINKSVKATTDIWPQMVQYYATDWDFILSRSEANGLLITNNNGKIAIINPLDDKTSVLSLTYGEDVIQFNGNLNSTNQLANVNANSWDYKSQNIVSGSATTEYTGAGNLSSKKLSGVVDLKDYTLQTAASLNEENLRGWSKAQILKSELSKFCGEVTCQGTGKVYPGQFITLNGLGKRFNGNHFVSGVTHTMSAGNWLTLIEFGLSSKWFTETSDVIAPPASGLLPGVNGLFTATVKKSYEDPDSQYRILVDIPLFDTTGEGLWARHGSFYASNNAGAFFLPEVGDEVIVGFLNEDPRFPIILGSLYSNSKLKPFEGLDPNENNTTKAIVSKSGIQITFDDENKIFTIVTPGKNTAVFNDKEKRITIKDENSNSIVMSDTGIVMKSSKDITIEADQSVTIKGNQGVAIESSAGDVNINGMNIKQSADVQFSAEGSASASVQGGGELTLKGAMVMIN
ncbi:type VI secretion system tip protein VgrG [Winogradskyella sp.]|uniref:type VI secretion system tip protein VgrG n=1 Tax=Winogradskyella sp. TaxID=1883156 RepID=UPI0025DE42C8|nr:type VI secretion system tip protein VgrG [Winogradskyella sp.]